MGALELMGWSSAAYQYGMLAVHWYWVGAIPAILFLAIFMMPFYHVSRTHSVPGYLGLRYGEAARGLSAITFVVMTLLASGIYNIYNPPDVFAANLHLDLIWGLVLLAAGMAFLFLQRPSRLNARRLREPPER